MKAIIGLGNVGEKYEETRHNVGFMVVDILSSKVSKENWSVNKRFQSLLISNMSSVVFIKPQTMMNNSGDAVKKIVDFYKVWPDDLWIIHDDLDIRLGEYKIQKGKGPREHNGLLSVYEKLGVSDFWHVRMGVDNRDPDNRVLGEDYVLQQFSEAEIETFNLVIDKMVTELVEKLRE